jgi:hypothetical protein
MGVLTEASRKPHNLPAVLAVASGAIVLIPSLLACTAAVIGVAFKVF